MCRQVWYCHLLPESSSHFPSSSKEGENVVGYQTTVEFDVSALEYVGSSNEDYLPEDAVAEPAVVMGNSVKLFAMSREGESKGAGTLATMTFKVIDEKASTVRLSEVLLIGNAGVKSRPRIGNGQVVEPRRSWDVNQDGAVDVQDLVFISTRFGKSGENRADVNRDGIVNIQDLVLVAGAFENRAAGPSAWRRDLEVVLTRAEVKQWLDQANGLTLPDALSKIGIRFLEKLLTSLTPIETVLLPNYPNPFNPETWVPYRLANDTDVQISIFDTRGVLVRRLDLGHQPAGFYTDKERSAHWDGRNESAETVASGAYFCQLRTRDFSQTRRMIIVK